MCGIVTVFSSDGPVSADALGRATKALYHRGPDGQRQWIAPHGRVGMGHARLSIIDLTTGDRRALCWSCDARVTWSDAAETVATRERTPA